jgi:cytochrome P450
MLPIDQPVPGKKELFHIQNVAGQLLLASSQPLGNQFYIILLFLPKDPDVYANVVSEVKAAYDDGGEITLGSVARENLKYLQACVSEGLRLHVETTDGLPRISPGAVVDGHYIPQGVRCSNSLDSCLHGTRY